MFVGNLLSMFVLCFKLERFIKKFILSLRFHLPLFGNIIFIKFIKKINRANETTFFSIEVMKFITNFLCKSSTYIEDFSKSL